jgi:delta-aminolevulinic acid dehydratase/porphobilinogen synthase
MPLSGYHPSAQGYSNLPIAAYQVLRHAMLKAACEKGWLGAESKHVVLETLMCFCSVGADAISMHHAKQAAL